MGHWWVIADVKLRIIIVFRYSILEKLDLG